MPETETKLAPSSVSIWISLGVILFSLAGGAGVVWWYLRSSNQPARIELAQVQTQKTKWPGTDLPGQADFFDAVRNGDAVRVKAMLDQNPALANARDGNESGGSVLHFAAWGGHIEVADVLMNRGADPAYHDKEYDGLPVSWAIVSGQKKMIEYFLSKGQRVEDFMFGMVESGLRGDYKEFSHLKPDEYLAIMEMLKEARRSGH